MADFYQSGVITTLHILGQHGDNIIEEELNRLSENCRTTLLIPALYSDFQKPAMKNILKILYEVKYISELIISVGKATEEEFCKVKEEMKAFPYKYTLLWMGSPDLNDHFNKLEEKGMKLGPEGKGKSCWISFGLILAKGNSDVIALHDSDILTYSKGMLSRLVYPIVNPHLPYEFSKGFYARFSNKLHGRVTRLFISPLLKSLQNVLGNKPLVEYLNSFRYHLAGEFALKTQLTRIIRFPSDWGLEISTLYEIFRNVALKRVCQVELTHRYDHKHQSLSKSDKTKGLNKMSIDISANIFKNLTAEGIILSSGTLRTIQKNYLKISEDIISNFHADAMINGMFFDRDSEESIVETFYKALMHSSENFISNTKTSPMLPNWNRITAAYPGFLEELKEIVEKDNI